MTMTDTQRTTVVTPAGPVASRNWRGSSLAARIRLLTARSLRTLVTDPRSVMLALLQPVILLVLFSQVFKSLAGTSSFPAGVSYIDYLVPAILVNTAMQSALVSGVGLTTDLTNGVVARFRAMPIWMGSVLTARSVTDLIRSLVQLGVIIVLAVAVFGFAPAGGVPGVLGALVLAMAVSWGLGWVFLAAATWLRNAELMQSIGFLVMFPLMFASSAFVPIAGLPGWLQAVAHVNPLTHAIDAARDLTLGHAAGNTPLVTAGLTVTLAAAGFTAALPGIRRP